MAFSLFAICLNLIVSAQQKLDTTKTSIYILDSDYSEYLQTDGRTVQKLVNNVKLLHGSDTLYCDSAIFYQSQNGFEAFGDVAIFQADGTEAFADYMRYTGNNKLIYMKSYDSDVKLSDGKGNNLWSKEINYSLATKIGNYNKGGTLQSDATILSSRIGTYNLRTKEATFQNNVDVNDPEYHVVSKKLSYNTENKIVRFLAHSVITNDKSILETSSGFYNTINKSGHFVKRSSILNEAQYVEADTLDYDRTIGFAIAMGNVIAIDTTQKSTLYCGYAKYNEISKVLIAYINPIMKTINDKDSLFIKGDTFYTQPAPLPDSLSAQDSLNLTAQMLHGSIGADSLLQDSDSTQISPSSDSTIDIANDVSAPSSSKADTMAKANLIANDSSKQRGLQKDSLTNKKLQTSIQIKPDSSQNRYTLNEDLKSDSVNYSYSNRPATTDTARPRYFTVYHNVWIYSDSLQGRCDSLSYAQQDSLMKMYVAPVLWQQGSQITGDIILMQMDKNQLKELMVPTEAIMISRSGPEQAGMYDQVQGNSIFGYFKNNKLDSMTAMPNASSIYFAKDEEDAYLGASEANSERIEIIFEEGKIKTIYYRKNVEQTMTPMKDVVPSNLHLTRFNWREDERPQDLNAFLNGVKLPQTPALLKDIKAEDK